MSCSPVQLETAVPGTAELEEPRRERGRRERSRGKEEGAHLPQLLVQMAIGERRRGVRSSVGSQDESAGAPPLCPGHLPAMCSGQLVALGAACDPRDCQVQHCGGPMQDHRLASLSPLKQRRKRRSVVLSPLW